ncbi:MAG: hypothetical protein A2Y38_04970 [Spirochaetes bacterium GWB1_59_5]|nr:MAG: hypothetical protein A2Y38_04970 [Spirochaetes bacterium GWB1_59_5]
MARYKTAVALFVCLLVPSLAVAAPDLGIAFGPWSFASGGPGPGIYAYSGLALGGVSRLEVEAFGVAELMPAPGATVLAGASVGLSLGGPRIPTYFNVVVDLGYIQTLVDDGLPGFGPAYLMLRLSPLVIGNPLHGHRDRMFSLGLLYDLEERSLSIVWNVLIVHWYPGNDSAHEERRR